MCLDTVAIEEFPHVTKQEMNRVKMLAFAQKLHARVIGDDDEIYAPDGTPSHGFHFYVRDKW